MLPHRGPGRSPTGKWISWIFDFRKKPSETALWVILSGGGAPKRRGARENSPAFPRFDGPVFSCLETTWMKCDLIATYSIPHSCSSTNFGVLSVFPWSGVQLVLQRVKTYANQPWNCFRRISTSVITIIYTSIDQHHRQTDERRQLAMTTPRSAYRIAW